MSAYVSIRPRAISYRSRHWVGACAKCIPVVCEEYVIVVGTDAFMGFVESIRTDGVVLERKAMEEGTRPKTLLVIEVDKENEQKDIAALDIEIPLLTLRVYRECKNLGDLGAGGMSFRAGYRTKRIS